MAALLTALVLILLLVIVARFTLTFGQENFRRTKSEGAPRQFRTPPNPPARGITWDPTMDYGYPYNYSLDTVAGPGEGRNRFSSTSEVDPIVTGQLYAGARAAGENRRFVYGQRTSFGNAWGMHEYSSGVPGEAGVDVGPLGMHEYSLDGGKPDVFDDGIPADWQMPSTPVSWYLPQGRDYYNVEEQGPSPYKPYILPLTEADHAPKIS